MIRRAALVFAVLSALVLAGCAVEPEPTPTVTVTVTATPEPAPTVTVTATPTAKPTPTETADAGGGAEDVDRTTEVKSVAGDLVTRAVENTPGEFTVYTSITDPRGEDGSPEAQSALAICEAVQQQLGATHVRVQESDESTFVVLGGAYTTCTEV
jgi:hypothetical protein